jgi:hypothetical protein
VEVSVFMPIRIGLHRLLWIAMLVSALGVRSVAQTPPSSPERLAGSADVIAVGKVSDLRSEWNENHGAIRTKVTLAVDEYLKGAGEGSSVTIYVPGGEVDGVGELYTHMATFKRDENVIVFATRDKQNRLRVSGGAEGKVVVKNDDATGVSVVSGRETKDAFVARIKNALKAGQQRNGN